MHVQEGFYRIIEETRQKNCKAKYFVDVITYFIYKPNKFEFLHLLSSFFCSFYFFFVVKSFLMAGSCLKAILSTNFKPKVSWTTFYNRANYYIFVGFKCNSNKKNASKMLAFVFHQANSEIMVKANTFFKFLSRSLFYKRYKKKIKLYFF